MKKFVALTAACFALSAGAAFAGTLDNLFGNTLTVTTHDGTVFVAHYNADHTYDMTVNGQASSGTWEDVNGQSCLTPTGGERTCYPAMAADKNVGDTWTQQGDGGVDTFAITAGR